MFWWCPADREARCDTNCTLYRHTRVAPPGSLLNYVAVQNVGTADVFVCGWQAGVRRILFASSVAAYGRQSADLLTVELGAQSTDLYGAQA